MLAGSPSVELDAIEAGGGQRQQPVQSYQTTSLPAQRRLEPSDGIALVRRAGGGLRTAPRRAPHRPRHAHCRPTTAFDAQRLQPRQRIVRIGAQPVGKGISRAGLPAISSTAALVPAASAGAAPRRDPATGRNAKAGHFLHIGGQRHDADPLCGQRPGQRARQRMAAVRCERERDLRLVCRQRGQGAAGSGVGWPSVSDPVLSISARSIRASRSARCHP